MFTYSTNRERSTKGKKRGSQSPAAKLLVLDVKSLYGLRWKLAETGESQVSVRALEISSFCTAQSDLFLQKSSAGEKGGFVKTRARLNQRRGAKQKH